MKRWLAGTILGLASWAGAWGAGFADPLDTPALPSELAPKVLVNALARAGGRIVAAGVRGHVLYSDDQGASWKQAAVPVRSDLTALAFPDASHGWAVGHDGVVLATTDGGASWVRQLDGRSLGPLLVAHYSQPQPGVAPETLARLRADAQRFQDEGPDKPFLDVWFEDAQRGYVVGAFNLILHTEDGGAHWLPWLDRTDNARALHLYSIRPAGGQLLIVGEQGLVLKLDRAAGQFRTVTFPYAGTLFGIAGNDTGALVFGLRGNAFHSADGGAHWARVETAVPVTLTAATQDGGELIVVSQTGQALRSGDGGATLQPVALETRVPASAVLSLGPQGLLLGGARGLHRVVRAAGAAR